MVKFFILGILLIGGHAMAEDILTLKLNNGIIQYDSTVLSGSSSTLGSPGLGFHKILNDKNVLGVEADIYFSVTTSAVSLYSVGLKYKYYLRGNPSYKENKTAEISFRSLSKWDTYFLGAFKRYTYYLGSNKFDETRYDQNGDFFNLDLGGGTAYEIGNGLKLFGEVSYTLFAFASSDDRIKFKSILVSTGISKEF